MKKQELIIILIPTVICVIAWMFFSFYDITTKSTIAPQDESLIIPINPTFETKVIPELKNRIRVEPYYGSATPTPISIKSLDLNNQKATSGGKLNK
jgi:hypothetical protein